MKNLIIVFSLVCFGLNTNAQNVAPRCNDVCSVQQKHSKKRVNAVKKGVRSGALTKKELRELKYDRIETRQMKKRMLADGKLNRKEQKVLLKRQKLADIKFKRKLTNDRRRG